MEVIVVLSDSATGDREFARVLAEKLGYRCVEPGVVIELAAARGFSHRQLREALEKPPGIWRRLLDTTRIHLTVLRAALVEEIELGYAVCYGNLGLLLPRVKGLLWIRVHHGKETLSGVVSERLALTPAEATAWIRKKDREAGRWRRWVCGPDHEKSRWDDYHVNVDSVDLDNACNAIAHVVRARADAADGSTQFTLLESLVISSRAEAAFALDPATAHLELDVRVERGSVSVRGRLRRLGELDEVRRVVQTLLSQSGCDFKLDMDGLSLPGGELPTLPALKPRIESTGMNAGFAWAAIALVMVLSIFYSAALSRVGSLVSSVLFRPPASVLQKYTGIITDTNCAANHDHTAISEPAGAECARRCVREVPGVRFALYDGQSLHVLADQASGDRFAGRRVVIVGSLNQEARTLTAKSIESL